MLKPVFSLLKKDLLLELRQQHTLYGILLYIASTIFVLSLSVDELDAKVWNGLFWVIYYYTIVSPVAFIIAKLLYNTCIMLAMSLVSLVLYAFFINNPLSNAMQFTGIVIIGGGSISLVFTLMSAIAAKASHNAALMAILGFPVILPLLLLLMRLSRTAFNEVFKEGAVLQLTGLIIGLDALIVAMAVILFPYLWKE
jgi:heme exporter protein B